MTDTNTPNTLEVLLDKVAQLIKTKGVGKSSEFSDEDLHHTYLSLVEGNVDQTVNEVLTKLVGCDWAKDLEVDTDADDELADDAKNRALVEFIEQIDETDPQDAAKILASALMMTCRELGWLEASRAAHDQWFFAEDTV